MSSTARGEENLTGRKLADRALRESEERYRALFNSMQEGFMLAEIVCDPAGAPIDWRYLEVNPSFESMFGRTRAELTGHTYRELFPDSDWSYWVSALGDVALTGRAAHLDPPAGEHGRQYRAIAYSPRAGQVAAIFSDVTESQQAHRELQASEHRYRTLFTGMSEGFGLGEAVFDPDGNPIDFRFLEINDAFERQSGLTRAILGKSIREVLPDLEPVWIRKYCSVAATGEPVRFEQYNRDTGRHYSVFSYRPSPGRFAVLFRDITEIKRAEEALRDRERQFRELADSLPQLVWIADAAGNATYFNRGWHTLLGIPLGDPIGDPWSDALHPDDRARAAEAWRRSVEAGDQYQIEYRFRAANGEYRWFLARGVPVHDQQSRISRWFGTCTDIDDSKRAEERLRQTQKLESVGLLAGGIAHDFNNLLTGIMGNASMVLDEVDPASAEYIKEVIGNAERAAHLTRQLLAYAGKGQFIIRDLDVSRAVQEIADLVQFSIPKSVDLAVTVQKRIPMVRMDPGQLQQILMNLVINAGEAIGEGHPGRIAVATTMADFDKPFVDALGEEIAPGRYVCIEVCDTGSGIAAAVKSRIFDPFFTTKFTGRGLGLAAVAGIIRAQKGGVTVESEVERGTTFRVFLPAAEHKLAGKDAQPGAAARATVLVVDDEASVRDFISAVLRKRGYRVLCASDGREALAVLDKEPGAFDAVILDVVMPVMGANELVPRLEERHPGVKVLLTSGYSESEARRLCAAYPAASFIQKPYTAPQIAAAVESLLDARPH